MAFYSLFPDTSSNSSQESSPDKLSNDVTTHGGLWEIARRISQMSCGYEDKSTTTSPSSSSNFGDSLTFASPPKTSRPGFVCFYKSLLQSGLIAEDEEGDIVCGSETTLHTEPSHSIFHCALCQRNGERSKVYRSHNLKDEHGRITCPVLRRYKCPKCGASGDTAHTLKYCPALSYKN